MRCCVDCWKEHWFETDSSIQMNAVCLIWLSLISVVISEWVPLLISKVLFRILLSFTWCMLCFVGQAWQLLFDQAFHVEYYLWCSYWLKLLRYVLAQVPLSPANFCDMEFIGKNHQDQTFGEKETSEPRPWLDDTPNNYWPTVLLPTLRYRPWFMCHRSWDSCCNTVILW